MQQLEGSSSLTIECRQTNRPRAQTRRPLQLEVQPAAAIATIAIADQESGTKVEIKCRLVNQMEGVIAKCRKGGGGESRTIEGLACFFACQPLPLFGRARQCLPTQMGDRNEPLLCSLSLIHEQGTHTHVQVHPLAPLTPLLYSHNLTLRHPPLIHTFFPIRSLQGGPVIQNMQDQSKMTSVRGIRSLPCV